MLKFVEWKAVGVEGCLGIFMEFRNNLPILPLTASSCSCVHVCTV
jgi:hypothetical protein